MVYYILKLTFLTGPQTMRLTIESNPGEQISCERKKIKINKSTYS